MTLTLSILSAALAAPASTSADLATATATCAQPFLEASVPADGEAGVGIDVQPRLLFQGTCGLWGSYELTDEQGVVSTGWVEPTTWVGFDAAVVTLDLPELAADTEHTLLVELDGEPVELSFTTGDGPGFVEGLPEGPLVAMTIDDQVLVPEGRTEGEAVNVFAVLEIEASEGLLVEVSPDEATIDEAFVSDGMLRVVAVSDTVDNDTEVCFYARTADAYGAVSPWTEVCEEVSVDEASETDDDDEREPYTPKRCATAPVGAAGGLAVAALLGLRRRR